MAMKKRDTNDIPRRIAALLKKMEKDPQALELVEAFVDLLASRRRIRD